MPRVAKAKKVVKKKVVEKPIVSEYTASIKIFGKVYTAVGESARDAISKLEVGKVAKGASVLTVAHGERTHSKILNSPQVMRLFTFSRMMREIALKQVSANFDF